MCTAPQLVWSNPNPAPHARVNARLLGRLSDTLVGCVRRGKWRSARRLVAAYAPTPIALAVVAGRLSRAGISEDSVLRLI